MKKVFVKLKKEILDHQIIYFLLFLTFVLGLFVRIWRVGEILGFWYDQGRDGLVIWDIIHKGKFTLIGPTTGIEGIFLGPFFYYFLTPAYWLGGGDPTAAAIWLGLVNSLTIVAIFLTGRVFFGLQAGIFAAVLLAFSANMVTFSRWLANPSPLPLFATIGLFALYQIRAGKKLFLILYAVILAVSLQIEAAAAIFFLPATVIFWIVFRPRFEKKVLFFSFFLFLVLSSSQLLFDLRHDFLISKSLMKFLLADRSFQLSFWETVRLRLPFYFETYNQFLFQRPVITWLLFAAVGTSFFLFRKKIAKSAVTILLIWIVIPLTGLIFYQGNYGYVWGYYLAGTLPAVFLIVGFFFQIWTKSVILAPLALFFLAQFFLVNTPSIKNYLEHGIGIVIFHQKQAIDFIYQDAGKTQFNVDVYVPPVIPYAYDYLFKWLGRKKYGFEPSKQQTAILYTFYEADFSHPERLEAWLKRQAGISRVVFQKSFGDITIQKRIRN